MPTVLIVEQDDATRELYQRELSRSYHVLISSGIDDSIELVQNHLIDIIVLEPAIADGAGWHLIEALRHDHSETPTPIVLCSALDERRRGKSLGAAAYLVKPVLPTTLLDTLNRVLQG